MTRPVPPKVLDYVINVIGRRIHWCLDNDYPLDAFADPIAFCRAIGIEVDKKGRRIWDRTNPLKFKEKP